MDTQKRHPATIIEVAKRAGVSPSTVSRVINGTALVAPETEQKVREAIAEFNFSPHPAARQLVLRRTNMLGLLLPEISGAFFQPMLRGVEAGVREAGYDLLIHSTQDTRHRSPARRPLGRHNTDGLIVFPDALSNEEIRHFCLQKFPLVLMYATPPEGLPIPMVTVENKSGAQVLVEHLITVHGCRRIAFLEGPDGQEDSEWRERGYREALETHGLDFDPELVGKGEFDRDKARAAVEQWLLDDVHFDAIFAGDDESASGAIQALREAGKRIPQDVAVVGFDDLSFSPYLNPPLTTVRAPTEQVGLEAVRQLVHLIRFGAAEREVLLPTELIIRQSCGCE